MAPFNAEAVRALSRAIRRRLIGPSTELLPDVLAAAVVEVAIEFLGDEDECSIEELDELLGLNLDEADWTLPRGDVNAATAQIARTLYAEDAIISLLETVTLDWSVVASTTGGTAAMMSDDGIGLYEFTVDDRVYFFTFGEPDVCDAQWWCAHDVGDVEARARAIEDGRTVIGLTADAEEW